MAVHRSAAATFMSIHQQNNLFNGNCKQY